MSIVSCCATILWSQMCSLYLIYKWQWAAVHLCALLKDIWWLVHNLALEICLLNSVRFPVIMGLLSMFNHRTKGKIWAPGFCVRGLHNHSVYRLSSVILSPFLVVYQLYFLLPTKTMPTKNILQDFANWTLRSEIVLWWDLWVRRFCANNKVLLHFDYLFLMRVLNTEKPGQNYSAGGSWTEDRQANAVIPAVWSNFLNFREPLVSVHLSFS